LLPDWATWGGQAKSNSSKGDLELLVEFFVLFLVLANEIFSILRLRQREQFNISDSPVRLG
jgi:hypothetical protein